MDLIINAKVVKQNLTLLVNDNYASGLINTVVVNFEFDETWSDFVKTAVFRNGNNKSYMVLLTQNSCYIPKEVLQNNGSIYIGVFGTKGDKVLTSRISSFYIYEGTVTSGEISEPSDELWQQILNAYGKCDEQIKQLQTALKDHKHDEYLTSETDPTVPPWAKEPTKPTYTAEEVGALPSDTPLFSGNYDDLKGIPSEFTPKAHTHDDLYYGKVKVDNKLTELDSKCNETYLSKHQGTENVGKSPMVNEQGEIQFYDLENEVLPKVVPPLIEAERPKLLKEVVETIKPTLTNLDERVTKNEKDIEALNNKETFDKNDLIPYLVKNTAQDRIINATDSAEFNIQGLKVYGESTQVQSTGAQCISAKKSTNKTINGITFEVISESKIRVYGTATDAADITGNFFILTAGEYTLSINTTMDSNKFRVCLIGNGGAPFLDVPNKQTFKTETISEMNYRLLVRVYKSVTIDFTFECMLAKGNKALPYEPYTNGLATPTHENPSPIISKIVNEITITGKNLFDINKIKTNLSETTGGIVNNGDGSLLVKNTANDSSVATNLTLQELCPELKAGDIVVMNYKNSNFVNHCSIYLDKAKFSFIGKKPTLIQDVYLESKVRLYPSSLTATTTTLSDIQIEYGDKATAYEPYKQPQSVTFSQPITLYSVKARNIAVPNVTIDGVKYLSDVITEKDGVYGVERNLYTTTTNNTYIGIYETKKGYYVKNAIKEVMDRADGYCNIATINYGSSVGKDNIWLGVQNTYAYILNSSFWDDSLEDKGLNNFMEFLKETPLVIVTHYKNPVFEPLPEADQQAIKALKSNYPTTVVTNNDNAFMQFDYVADTKNYVNNLLQTKVNELMYALSDTPTLIPERSE